VDLRMDGPGHGRCGRRRPGYAVPTVDVLTALGDACEGWAASRWSAPRCSARCLVTPSPTGPLACRSFARRGANSGSGWVGSSHRGAMRTTRMLAVAPMARCARYLILIPAVTLALACRDTAPVGPSEPPEVVVSPNPAIVV